MRKTVFLVPKENKEIENLCRRLSDSDLKDGEVMQVPTEVLNVWREQVVTIVLEDEEQHR